jgi:hypothetical protein
MTVGMRGVLCDGQKNWIQDTLPLFELYIQESHMAAMWGGGGDSSYKHLLSGHALPLDSSSFSERDEAAILE